jgi:integrase
MSCDPTERVCAGLHMARTRKDVADQLAVLIAKTKAGLPLAVESWTLERFAEHWLTHVVGPRLRPSTLSSYRETLRLHVLPTLGRTNLRSLTPTHVRTLLANKAADGLGARSVQIIHSTLRSMLSEAMREELIERNVVTVVRPPSVERVEVQPWSTEEASRFLAASADHRLHALFAVGVALGLRKGELLALRWDDVDLEGGVLNVPQNVQRLPEMGLVFGPPKSNKSRRTIPLPAASAKVLRTLRANQAAEALALGPAWVDSGLVITSKVGTVIEPRNLNRFFDEPIPKQACAELASTACGIPARPSCLRRTCQHAW